MAKSTRGGQDPLLGFNFALEIQGTVTGYFTECSGIGSENEVVEHKIVTDKGVEITQKIPGRLKWTDITMKRGITDNMDIWNWRKLVEEGKMDEARKSGSIIMFNRSLEPVAEWTFENAWPSKVTGPSVKADSNEVGVEELTIAIEQFIRNQ
jgi:phage tail-like protein